MSDDDRRAKLKRDAAEYLYRKSASDTADRLRAAEALLESAYTPEDFERLDAEADAEREAANEAQRTPVLLDDALKEPAPQESYLIDGLLPEAGVALVAGESGSGKTTLVGQVSLCLSAGRGILGWSVPRAVPVALFIGEGSRRLSLERLHVAAAALGIEKPNLYVPPVKMLVPAFASAEFEEFIERCARLDVRLVVADPLRRFFPGDENSSTAFMAGVTKPLRDLAVRYGMAFCLIHHLSKPSEYRDGRHRVRGTGAMLDDVDLALRLERRRGAAPTDRSLAFDKVRHGMDLPPMALTFDSEHAVFELEAASTTDRPTPAAKLREDAERVYRVVLLNPGVTHDEIGSATQMRRADRLAAHRLLKDSGRIYGQPKGDGKTFGWHVSTTPRQRQEVEVPGGSHEVPLNAGTSPGDDEVPEVPAFYKKAEPGTSSSSGDRLQTSAGAERNRELRLDPVPADEDAFNSEVAALESDA